MLARPASPRDNSGPSLSQALVIQEWNVTLGCIHFQTVNDASTYHKYMPQTIDK